MIKFIDKLGLTAEIELTDLKTGQNWERDFFADALREFDQDTDAYRVNDVAYMLDYVEDFMQGRGDFLHDGPGKLANSLYAATDIPLF